MPLTPYQQELARLLSANRSIQLHPVDLAINKVLALVGRDEARDFSTFCTPTTRSCHLGALCWAAAGKDPGFTPLS